MSHKHCDLGAWYYSKGLQRFGNLPEFQAIEKPLEQIHAQIAEVVRLREQGNIQAAEAAFERVSSLSNEIVDWLDNLSRAVG